MHVHDTKVADHPAGFAATAWCLQFLVVIGCINDVVTVSKAKTKT